MTFPIAKPAPVSETYTMDGDESTRTAELVFAYLATTIGPRSHRASHLWTPHYRAILSGVLRRAYLHPSLAGAACIFIGRLKQRRPLLELSGKAGLKLFIAALVVADKCIHDCSLARKAWVGVLDGVLTLQELSQLELELLVGIEWQTLLRKQLCYDMQELGKGWWAMKHNGCSPDFFTGQRWDGRRPWAFEFFDGLSKDIKYRYMWTPCYPSTTKSPSNTELPVFHHASHSIWDTIKPGVDPPVKRKPPLPSSPLCSGSTSGSDSSGSPSDSDEDCSSKSSCDSTPPNAECLPCPLYSGKVVARTTPDALQMVEVELIEDVSRENLSREPAQWTRSVEPTDSGSFLTPPEDSIIDDLPPVDWSAEFTPFTESDKRMLGFKLRHPVPLKEFCVNTLSLPSFYSPSDRTLESRIGKWVSQVPYGWKPSGIEVHRPPLPGVHLSEEPSSLGSFIFPTACSSSTLNKLQRSCLRGSENGVVEEGEEEKKTVGARLSSAMPIIKCILSFIVPSGESQAGQTCKNDRFESEDWVGVQGPVKEMVEMVRTIS